MTERGGTIIFRRILAPPQCPPPIHSPDPTILIYLKDREGAPLSFVGFWRPPPSPDATIPNNINDREEAPLCLYDFSVTNAPPPPTTP